MCGSVLIDREKSMLRFPCTHCGLTLNASENVGDTTVCPNCNTRQPVPPFAVPLTPEEERALVVPPTPPGLDLQIAAIRQRPPGPPEYLLLEMAGWALIVAGPLFALLGAIVAVSAARASSPFSGSGLDGPLTIASAAGCIQALIACILLMGLGQLFHAIRDIARNSWRPRTAP